MTCLLIQKCNVGAIIDNCLFPRCAGICPCASSLSRMLFIAMESSVKFVRYLMVRLQRILVGKSSVWWQKFSKAEHYANECICCNAFSQKGKGFMKGNLFVWPNPCQRYRIDIKQREMCVEHVAINVQLDI